MTAVSSASIPFSQQVGMTETALRALLDNLLAQAGTGFPEWVALQTLARRGGSAPFDGLRLDLAGALRLDETSVSDLLDRLQAEGAARLAVSSLADDGVLLQLTVEGEARHRQLSQAIGNVTSRLLDGIDAGDIETALTTLRCVAERASAMLAD